MFKILFIMHSLWLSLMQRVDKEGKISLKLASMNPQLQDVAKTLIELGANLWFIVVFDAMGG